MTYHEALTTIRSALQSVDESDRQRLAETILDELESVQRSSVIELTDEQKAELDRRIAEDDANPDAGYSWEEVQAAARARHRR